MFNRSISLESLAAWFCWVTGFALAIGDWTGFLHGDSGPLGVVLVAMGHLICMHHMMSENHERERAAFELGKEAGSVRRVR